MTKKKLSYERYQRQLILEGFGEDGQRKLLRSRVLVVGAGGLGCPALLYLAAAGVGKIGIVDDDRVALHNLHRQVLFNSQDIGSPKASVAADRLRQMNADLEIVTHALRLTNQNALTILEDYDLVLDATDNFATRYIINDACVLQNKPLVYGAISQFEGQVAIFNVEKEGQAVNYRDLFPHPPEPGSVLNCAEAGVLGVLPGIIGTLQATEVIKLLTGIGKPLVNQLFTYNALTNESFVFDLSAKEDTATLLPKTPAEFSRLDYVWLCEGAPHRVEEIDAANLASFLQKEDTTIIDVREKGEKPEVEEFAHRQLPLSVLKEGVEPIKEHTIVLFCQSGKRSREAAGILSATFGAAKKIYSLKGGILNWKQHGKEA